MTSLPDGTLAHQISVSSSENFLVWKTQQDPFIYATVVCTPEFKYVSANNTCLACPDKNKTYGIQDTSCELCSELRYDAKRSDNSVL